MKLHTEGPRDLESGWNGRRVRWRHRPDRAAYRRYRERFDRRVDGREEFWEVAPRSYWERTRGPIAALAIVVPMLGLYEGGLVGLAERGAIRTGADAWFLAALRGMTPVPSWIGSFILVAGLLVWQAVDRNEWWCGPMTWLGMILEGCLLGVGLVGLSRLIDLGFVQLEGHRLLADGGGGGLAIDSVARAVGFVGAGVFEEGIFRLALIPLFYGLLRLLQAPTVLATTTAVTASSLLFAMAHHLGDPSGEFIWFVFIFRWAAGVYFAWAFLLRGFGVVVVAHVAYDLLVGCLGWAL